MTQTVAVISDIHCPYHDPKALKVASKVLKDLQPDRVILLGDIVDFYSVSGYNKTPDRINNLQDDCNTTHDLIGDLVECSHRSKWEYIEGNHENRLDRLLLSKAQELWCLDCLSVDRLLRLEELDIEYKMSTDIGPMTAIHGYVVRKHSGYTAKAMAETHGSVISGHTHRLGSHYRTDGRGQIMAFENGCLCDLSPEYITGIANWQHGFSIVTENSGNIGVEQIHIVDGLAYFRGKRW